jgi:hypothetical protein
MTALLSAPVALGAPVNGMSLGQIVESNHPDWRVGDYVRVFATWSDHFVIGPDALGLERVTPAANVPLRSYMGALGPVGLTAWVGLFAVGEANAGETVLVSAAGATGSTVVQLAGGGVPGGGHGGRRRTRHRSCANWARMRWWIIAPSRVIWAQRWMRSRPKGSMSISTISAGLPSTRYCPGCAKKGASHSAA